MSRREDYLVQGGGAIGAPESISIIHDVFAMGCVKDLLPRLRCKKIAPIKVSKHKERGRFILMVTEPGGQYFTVCTSSGWVAVCGDDPVAVRSTLDIRCKDFTREDNFFADKAKATRDKNGYAAGQSSIVSDSSWRMRDVKSWVVLQKVCCCAVRPPGFLKTYNAFTRCPMDSSRL